MMIYRTLPETVDQRLELVREGEEKAIECCGDDGVYSRRYLVERNIVQKDEPRA